MKLKFLPLFLILLFFAANAFSQDVQPAVQEEDHQKQEKLLKKQEKERIEAEKKQQKELEKQQKAEQAVKEEQEAKEKKEQEKLLKKQQKEQKRQEEEKEKQDKELTEQQKIEQIEQMIQADKDKRAEAKQKKRLENLESKKQKKQEKDEKRRLKLQKKQDSADMAAEEPYSALVLDYDLRFRAASYSNLDYTSSKAKSGNIYQQYLGVNIIGKFDNRIEMSAKLGSYGISGKHNGIFSMPYSDDDFSFFLESAYLNFRSETGFAVPYILTFGKQYFTAGDGFIIDSNQNGFLGARVRADITHLFSVDAFAGKVDNEEFNIYGGSLKIKLAPVVEIGIYQERNDTGFAYQKGILVDDPRYAIKSDIKTFYDIRLTGGNQKYKYKLEAAQQTGELAVSSTTDSIEYDSFAFVAEGSWSGTFFKRKSNAKLIFSYADADDENSFNPTFSKRYDGLQRVGYGALFAAGSGDSFLILPDGYRGINTIGVSFDIEPWDFLQTGLAFYMYSASDAPADAGDAGFGELYGAKADLGNEIDFFVRYRYFEYFDIGLGVAMYTPPADGDKVFSNTETSYLYQIEVKAKF